jgi:aconitase B
MSGTNFPNGIKYGTKTVTGNTTVAAVTATDGEAAAGATPTKAEYDVVVTLANSTKTQLNDLIARLKTAGIIL